ncbi:MAG: methyl-accepting chemotaxis protein [Hydrogenophaga sp.]|uniref:methyl-accepting chemotaxis protein n=1 Tax=Hydrogenophaga sp. TaxID=1904254 RepID=UPI0027349154|nr:PAS domain-containing methyl-accepting chemotaxis protein [Hydrogenophaga sp.]MDP3628603.1 methyl-accepting chemotaxis protein [Hydrogenophaga sp.]
MRTNLPVSHQEYPFPRGQTLVSTTDTKGRILYCNPSFVEVSGYEKDELLGQPHNLIRHPDMPEEAFRDMWATIASGRPWSAPVKNRRKNGDFYWVMANATPLLENGQPVGYMSVRTEATREQVAAAERLYATMREEKAQSRLVHALKAGRLVKNTVGGKLAESLQLGLAAKVLVALLVLVLVGPLMAWWLPQMVGLGGLTTGLNVALPALALLLGWRYICGLTVSPLGDLVVAANRMAAGDMTGAVTRTRNDQLGDLQTALSQLSVNLKSIVRDAREQSGEMVHATTEIAQGNLDLSQRTEAQASNLEQTAASMEEITGTVRLSAESAAQASALSAQVVQVSERGSVAVDEVGSTMKSINDASRRIGEITQVIDGIAFQTNILALNAAVEAARAGEQGRGFAVVASEVRALAQRSLTAAKEIKLLIDNSAKEVAVGAQKTEAARQTMAEAVKGVRQVSTLVDEISNATREQLMGISQINAAVAQMDTMTQQNAALVEEIAASAQALEGLARSTTETVQVFKIDEQRAQVVNAVELRRNKVRQGGMRQLAAA